MLASRIAQGCWLPTELPSWLVRVSHPELPLEVLGEGPQTNNAGARNFGKRDDEDGG